MSFVKGQSGNPSGRPPGVANKVQRGTRELIERFVNEKYETVLEEFDNLDGMSKIAVWTKLASLICPKPTEADNPSDVSSLTPEERYNLVYGGLSEASKLEPLRRTPEEVRDLLLGNGIATAVERIVSQRIRLFGESPSEDQAEAWKRADSLLLPMCKDGEVPDEKTAIQLLYGLTPTEYEEKLKEIGGKEYKKGERLTIKEARVKLLGHE